MRLAFLVNDVDTEVDEYATTRLARGAARGGHETWYVGVGDLELGSSDGLFAAMARAARWKSDDTLASFMEGIKAREAERIIMDDLDALVLRNESIDDLQERPWASPMGVVFGQMLADRGVTVVNDPNTLHRATSKLYLEEFPEKVRPRSRRSSGSSMKSATASSNRCTGPRAATSSSSRVRERPTSRR
jgi:glutathione synthase